MLLEGDIQHPWGNISGFEMASRFWKGCVQGAYVTHGETFYSEDEVLWWARGGKLKGESPKRIAYLRKFIEELPGALEPWDAPWMIQVLTMKVSEEAKKTPIVGLICSVDPVDLEDMAWKDAQFGGHVGEPGICEIPRKPDLSSVLLQFA